MIIFELCLRLAVCGLAFAAAFLDLRAMRIPNWLTLSVAALFLPLIFVWPLPEILAHVVVAALMFALGAALFFARLFGGGDVKLIAALSLWLAPADLPVFLLLMSLFGGMLSLAAIALKHTALLPKLAEKTPESSWFARLGRGETVVPYGVAIALAAALTLF